MEAVARLGGGKVIKDNVWYMFDDFKRTVHLEICNSAKEGCQKIPDIKPTIERRYMYGWWRREHRGQDRDGIQYMKLYKRKYSDIPASSITLTRTISIKSFPFTRTTTFKTVDKAYRPVGLVKSMPKLQGLNGKIGFIKNQIVPKSLYNKVLYSATSKIPNGSYIVVNAFDNVGLYVGNMFSDSGIDGFYNSNRTLNQLRSHRIEQKGTRYYKITVGN